MSLVVNHNLMAANVARNLNSHYNRLATSTQRLSSGLRINSAADDAAGLAIRELQRADIAALHQGSRNANDAISLIQTADGALGVIDEKLIRMKELAEQAATGTYNSTQRLMIDSEFQAMANEIQRIADSTDFNGIHLLNGNLNGKHDGSGLKAEGALKIHFGTGNDSAEDYYYIDIPSSTLVGLGLAKAFITLPDPPPIHVDTIADVIKSKGGIDRVRMNSGIRAMSYIPKGATNVTLLLDSWSQDDDLQIFTRDGYHVAGTPFAPEVDITWVKNTDNIQINDERDFEAVILNTNNGFDALANKYKMPGDANETGKPILTGTFNNGADDKTNPVKWDVNNGKTITYFRDPAEQMNITYSGDANRAYTNQFNSGNVHPTLEKITIDNVTEDLLVFVTGSGVFDLEAHWDQMPDAPADERRPVIEKLIVDDIQTQDKAQKMLVKINGAIEIKDKIRAHLGAMQNRLENTITNLNTQAENLQSAESRISDTDVATEMTNFVRNQILTQSAVAMLSQANSLPQMAMQLLGG